MNENYTFWLTLAVVLGAVALLVQAACLFAMYRAFAHLKTRSLEFVPKAEATLVRVEQSLSQGRADMVEMTTKAHAIMDLAQGQLTRVDEFVTDTTTRARVQVDRAEALIDESLGRVRHTVGLVNETVARPVREVNAVTAGLRAAIGTLFAKRRETASPNGYPPAYEPAEEIKAAVSEVD